MKKIKKSKFNFEKCTVLEFKNLISIKGGQITQTGNGKPISTDICQEDGAQN